MTKENNTRTKIVATIGPACANKTILTSMMRGGMDAARLNFSHATHADHKRTIALIRSCARAVHKHVPIIGDLQGPKIRIGSLPEGGVKLETGSSISLDFRVKKHTSDVLPITYADLQNDVKLGDKILIDDGLIELKVKKIRRTTIDCFIVNGGVVTSHKGMNFPDSEIKIDALTDKDKEDILFGLEQNVEFFALSFVSGKDQVLKLKKLIKQKTPDTTVPPLVIVKIEKSGAVKNFDEILTCADGIMIARGDLGLEIPAAEVPIRQKEMIEKCRLAGKPVIVATQMLDSMIRNPRPTRAEVSDVANAVFDHTDAVMLSGESATGKYPLESVRTMNTIIEQAEASKFDDVHLVSTEVSEKDKKIAHAIKFLSDNKDIEAVVASYVLAPWSVGILGERPEIPFYVFVGSDRIARQLIIRWGIIPVVMRAQSEKSFAKSAISNLKKGGLIRSGASVAVLGLRSNDFGIETVK